jgi:hypothetical protein
VTAREFWITFLIWIMLAVLLSLTPLYWWAAGLIAFVLVYGGFVIISGDMFGEDWGW